MYMCRYASGFDHTLNMIKGRSYGGVAIFYMNSFSSVLTHIQYSNRRASGINIKLIIYRYIECHMIHIILM